MLCRMQKVQFLLVNIGEVSHGYPEGEKSSWLLFCSKYL